MLQNPYTVMQLASFTVYSCPLLILHMAGLGRRNMQYIYRHAQMLLVSI